MKKVLQDVVQEIAHGLVLKIESPQCVEKSASVSIIDLLLQQLVKEVARQLIEANAGEDLSDENSEAKLQKVETKLEKQLTEADTGKGLSDENVQAKLEKVEKKLEKRGFTGEDEHEDNDEDEAAGTGSSYPNLKYARPKYKNIESILKYIERDEEKGGVKLVIMNFND